MPENTNDEPVGNVLFIAMDKGIDSERAKISSRRCGSAVEVS